MAIVVGVVALVVFVALVVGSVVVVVVVAAFVVCLIIHGISSSVGPLCPLQRQV